MIYKLLWAQCHTPNKSEVYEWIILFKERQDGIEDKNVTVDSPLQFLRKKLVLIYVQTTAEISSATGYLFWFLSINVKYYFLGMIKVYFSLYLVVCSSGLVNPTVLCMWRLVMVSVKEGSQGELAC